MSYLGAETEEAAPASQPVAAPVVAPVAAQAPPQPAADSLLGDLLMDVGPTQPTPPPVQPAGIAPGTLTIIFGSRICTYILFLEWVQCTCHWDRHL